MTEIEGLATEHEALTPAETRRKLGEIAHEHYKGMVNPKANPANFTPEIYVNKIKPYLSGLGLRPGASGDLYGTYVDDGR